MLGDMDPAFLDLPPEVIRTSMRTHQKYFAVRDPATGALAPHFVVVANIEAADGGELIAAGNARVLSARLKDAQFFWDEDRKRRLGRLAGEAEGRHLPRQARHHVRAGGAASRRWPRELAPLRRRRSRSGPREAARLAKADLATGMVGEFPELQGVMGGYYAREAGLARTGRRRDPRALPAAGPERRRAGQRRWRWRVALADKLDTLVGFFAIGEKPTGSRDPYALRRAALGDPHLESDCVPIRERSLVLAEDLRRGAVYARGAPRLAGVRPAGEPTETRDA